jgi:predicted DCC family thiol-disulfide oxidoreductase YuxK/N-acetylglutamate synthase-like GNAT family acetyltransferase
MIVLGEHLTQHQKDALNLTPSEIVVAAEEDYIIGFGILEKARDDTGCLRVEENARRHEIGAFVVRHLLDYAPMKTIYVASDKPGYFRKLNYSKKERYRGSSKTIQATCADGTETVRHSPQTKNGELKIRNEMVRKKISGTRTVLIYDGACPVCSQTIQWIAKNAKENTFEMLPCQSDVLNTRFPSVARSDCMKAIHVVLPDGVVLSGSEALPVILKKLGSYRSLAVLFKLPGVMFLSHIFYGWFAHARYWVAGFIHVFQQKNR